MVVEATVEITAPVERVWEILVDLAAWPRWNSVLRHIPTQDGDALRQGLRFRCTVTVFALPIRFAAVVAEVVRPERIAWTSDWLGIHAYHEFLCAPVDGRVRVTSRETFRGATTVVAGPLFPVGRVRQLATRMLLDLKRAAEG